MATMQMFDYTVSDLETFGDNVKDIVLSNLQVEGLVSTVDAMEYCKTHIVVMKRPSFVSRFYRKLKGDEQEPYIITVAKLSVPLLDETKEGKGEKPSV